MRFFLFIILLFTGTSLLGQSARNFLKAAEQFILNGYYEDAVEQYDQAVLFEPANGKIYEDRAKAYQQLGQSQHAAKDFKKAAVLGTNPAVNFFSAAQLYYSLNQLQESVELINKAIEQRSKYHEAYVLQCKLFLVIENYTEALTASINAIDAKSTAYAQYLKGVSEHRLGNLSQAEQDLEKAIIKDKMILDAYLELAEIQLQINKTKYAIDNCSYVLMNNPNNCRALTLRSVGYYMQKDFSNAVFDISKAIASDTSNSLYYIQRGRYYLDLAKIQDAIFDFSNALTYDMLNTEALLYRAEAYEQMGLKSEASSDLLLLLTLLEDADANEIVRLKKKIFELNREQDKPLIHLSNPVMNENLDVLIPRNAEVVQIVAKVEDASNLKFFKVNNDTLLNNPQGGRIKDFNVLIAAKDLEFLTLSATDIYDNTATVSYVVERIETNPPKITLLNPYVGDDSIIVVGNDDKYLYLEGRIEDESLISSIYIDEITASYAPGDINPRFTATLNIAKKNRIRLTATDIYGNAVEQEYFFKLDGRVIADESPMGKTWVILIENSEYKDFPNLTSPAKDIQLMQEALIRYKIHKTIVKRNLTKREMERFFSIDLRDLIRTNQVNSLIIWYAGHGVNISGTGYWIPSDARLNSEFSYYNMNALRASLYSYTSLTHILIVSDACETGNSFFTTMRGPSEGIACSNLQLASKKSAQVFTSSGSGYAHDNPLFARAFANALLNNEDDCATIDDIVKRVGFIMQYSSTQKPEFGRIRGFDDELGTFFFMTR